jgi:hypothetical protein
VTREISDRMRGAIEMEELLRTTIRETAAALGAKRAFVQWVEPEALTGSRARRAQSLQDARVERR